MKNECFHTSSIEFEEEDELLEYVGSGVSMGARDAMLLLLEVRQLLRERREPEEDLLERYDRALNRVTRSLKNEVPKPVKGEKPMSRGYHDTFYCGVCGRGLIEIRGTQKYCPSCGRATDWTSIRWKNEKGKEK